MHTIHELSHLGLIRFSGPDAQAFLHSQLSCDVAALKPGRSTYGAYCTPKGRMLASFLLWRAVEHDFYLQLPSSLRETIQKQLTKFILRSKVKATDATGERAPIGVAGGSAGEAVRRATGQAPKDAHEVAVSADAMVLRLPLDRYEVVAAREKAPAMLAALAEGGEKKDAEHWDWLEIRAGVPMVLPPVQEELVPQMANLDLIGGVSYEKGCYPGQEIVARMHYRGTLKQRMYRANVATDGKVEPGSKLYSPAFGDQACGTVINAARSPEGGYDLLAAIQITAAKTGEVRWNAPDGPAVTLLSLPYAIS
jgi:folate-binding protein YgfZ